VLHPQRPVHLDILFSTDKGLGPCTIKRERYIRDAQVHLLDKALGSNMQVTTIQYLPFIAKCHMVTTP